MKMDRTQTIFTILIIILLFSAYYIVHDIYKEKSVESFNNGVAQGQMGYSSYMFNNAILCNKIPIGNGSQTMTLIALECLKGD